MIQVNVTPGALVGTPCHGKPPAAIVNIGNAKLGHPCLFVSARMLEVLSEFSHSALSSGVGGPGKRVDVANAQGETEREGYSFCHAGRKTAS